MSEQNQPFQETPDEAQETAWTETNSPAKESAAESKPADSAGDAPPAPPATSDTPATSGAGYRPGDESRWPKVPTMPDPTIHKRGEELENEPTLSANQTKLQEALGKPVPSGVKDLQTEWHYWSTQKSGPISAALADRITERKNEIKKRLNIYNNGLNPKPIQFTANHQATFRAANSIRPVERAEDIAKLKRYLENQITDPTFFSKLSFTPIRQIEPWANCLLSSEMTRTDITELRLGLAPYELKRLESFPLIFPTSRIDEIKEQFSTETDNDKLQALQNELAALSLPTSRTVAETTSSALHGEWVVKCEPLIKRLLDGAIHQLECYLEAIIKDEKSLCAYSPMQLEYEPTRLDKALEGVIKRLRDMSAEVGKYPHYRFGPMEGGQTPLHSVFGLTILGD